MLRYVLPVLWMTSSFHTMKPKGHNQARCYVQYRISSPGGGTRWTSRQLVFGLVRKNVAPGRSLLSTIELFYGGIYYRRSVLTPAFSVGIDLKELGGQMSKCLKFYPGVEI